MKREDRKRLVHDEVTSFPRFAFRSKGYISWRRRATIGGGMAETTRPAAAVDAPPVPAEDFAVAGRAILPKAIFDYFACGGEGEAAPARNREGIGPWRVLYHPRTGG